MVDFKPAGCGAPGDWTYYASTDMYNAYTLSVGSLFLVHLRQTGGKTYYTFNGQSNVCTEPRDILMQAAEREIVRRVREMMPAYKAIYARVQAADALKGANVTVLRPKRD